MKDENGMDVNGSPAVPDAPETDGFKAADADSVETPKKKKKKKLSIGGDMGGEGEAESAAEASSVSKVKKKKRKSVGGFVGEMEGDAVDAGEGSVRTLLGMGVVRGVVFGS